MDVLYGLTREKIFALQLSFGLSSEYTNKPSEEKQGLVEKVNADQKVFAKYYLNQILQVTEEGIASAWYVCCQAFGIRGWLIAFRMYLLV